MSQMKNLLPSRKFRSLVILWGATAVSCLIIFYPFLFGGRLVVFNDAGSDTRQQYLMQHATIVNHLRSGNFSLWDMNLGFGASMFALNLFHLFLLPVYAAGALLGAGHIPTLLLYMMLVQFFLAGTFCYLFLSCFSLSEPGKVAASYLYAFNGYLLVWGQHYHFGAYVVFLPLLLFLLERAMQKKRFSPAVPLLTAVMVCSSTYMSYMSLLMAGAYVLFRAVLEDGRPSLRVRLFLARCGELLLGIGIGSVIFLPSAHYLLTVSTRLDSDSSFLERMLQYCSLFPASFYRTAFLRFFSTTFEGIAHYGGYSNFYEAPVLFFSALFVILAPQYLVSIHRQETSRKAKVLQYLALLLSVLCLFVRLGASVFNAFAYPFSRHSFLFMPLFALVTARMLDQTFLRRKLNLPALVLSVILIVCAHAAALHQNAEPKLRGSILFLGAAALLMALLVLLARLLKSQTGRGRRIAASLLFLCVMANVICEGWLCYNERDTLTTSDPDYWGGLYDPNVEAALSWLRETDSSLYRVEKDYYSGSYCMDGLAQGYRGISAYNSTPNRSIEEFVNLVIPNFPIMARYEYTFRQIGYDTGHSSLFGIKYLLSRNPALALDGFRQIGQFGTIYVYQNENVSSFARFYTKTGDSAVLKTAYGEADLETMLLDVALLDADQAGTALADACSSDELLADYALEEIQKMDSITADGSSDSAVIPIDRESLADFEHVYLAFDLTTPQVSDITVNIDDPLEYHFRTEAGRPRHVQIPVPSSYQEVNLSRYGAPLSGEITNIRLLGSKRTADPDSRAVIRLPDTSNDSHLQGSITAEADGFLFLPIPYEEGWTATLDGGSAELLRTDIGFVSIPVPAGEHSFTLTYRQPWMREGAFISVLSLAVWLLLTVLQKKKVKRGAQS